MEESVLVPPPVSRNPQTNPESPKQTRQNRGFCTLPMLETEIGIGRAMGTVRGQGVGWGWVKEKAVARIHHERLAI